MTVLYGDLDIVNLLKHINDEFFSKYEKEEVAFTDPLGDYWEGNIMNMYYYPAFDESSECEAIAYSFGGMKLNAYDEWNLKQVINSLISPGGKIYNLLATEFPSAIIDLYDTLGIDETNVVFLVKGIPANQFELFKELFDKALAETLNEGIDKDILEALIKKNKVNGILSPENSEYGIKFSDSILLEWSQEGNENAYLGYEYAFVDGEANLEGDYYNELLKAYYNSVKKSVCTLVVPEFGASEKQAIEEYERLKALKDNMSEEEIDNLINETKEYYEWLEKNDNNSLIVNIQAVDPRNAVFEHNDYKADSYFEDGVMYVSGEIDRSDLVKNKILLNASTIPFDMVDDLGIYALLLTNIPTKKHSVEELDELISKYLPELSISAKSLDKRDGEVYPYLVISYYTSKEDSKIAYDLLKEILTESDFSQYDTIRNLLAKRSAEMANSVYGNNFSFIYSLSKSMLYKRDAYNYEFNDIEKFLPYMRSISNMKDNELADIINRLEQISILLLNKNGCIMEAIGDEEGVALTEEIQKIFVEEFSDEINTEYDYGEYPINEKRNIAIVINETVSYVQQLNSLPEELSETGLNLVLGSVLEAEYIFPYIRYELGGYGSWADVLSDTAYLHAFCVPDIEKTCKAFSDGRNDYLNNISISQDELDGYILNKYQHYSKPKGDFISAESRADSIFLGYDYWQLLEEELEGIQNASPEKICEKAKDLATYFEEDTPVLVVLGSKSDIYKNADMFDHIIEGF